MKKKFIKLGLATILSTALVLPVSVFAETETQVNDNFSTGAALDDPNYIQNEDYYESLEEERDKQIEKEEQVFQKKRAMLAATANEYYTIPVTYNKAVFA